jgi:hypothetical protein
VLCLVQVVDNTPRSYTIAENLADLRRQLPEEYAYKSIRAVLERIAEEPSTGKFRLGDGYWLLVSRTEPSWLDRMLGS